MKIINQTKNTILAEDVIMADTPLKRIKGLLGRKEFKKGQAIILRPCNSIHTFFMRFPIDVLFVNREFKVIGLKSCVKPWRISPIYWRAKFAVELPCGVILEFRTSLDDEISLTW